MNCNDSLLFANLKQDILCKYCGSYVSPYDYTVYFVLYYRICSKSVVSAQIRIL
jgi:hypothetical protein